MFLRTNKKVSKNRDRTADWRLRTFFYIRGSQTIVRVPLESRKKNFEGTRLREQVSYVRTSTTAFRQQSHHHHHHHFLGLLSHTNQHIIAK